jgi:TonB family protein
MSEKEFQQSLGRTSIRSRATENTVAYTIVATCGSEQRVFRVPYVKTIDLKVLRKLSPNAADIVDLYSNIESRFFHGELLNNSKHPKDQKLQATAQRFLPDLKSGRFDAGFDQNRLKDLLQMYQGPIAAVRLVPKVVDFDKWKFLSFVDPTYPEEARESKVETKVELEITVDPASGYVKGLRIVRGNRLFTEASTDAAIQWIFDPAQNLTNPVKITLDYSLGCKVEERP